MISNLRYSRISAVRVGVKILHFLSCGIGGAIARGLESPPHRVQELCSQVVLRSSPSVSNDLLHCMSSGEDARVTARGPNSPECPPQPLSHCFSFCSCAATFVPRLQPAELVAIGFQLTRCSMFWSWTMYASCLGQGPCWCPVGDCLLASLCSLGPGSSSSLLEWKVKICLCLLPYL
jgi:hypothetical protein